MVKKIISNIIFDLDGTLIDSSTSILESFESAFSACNLEPIKPLNTDIIGLTLMETFFTMLKYSNFLLYNPL